MRLRVALIIGILAIAVPTSAQTRLAVFIVQFTGMTPYADTLTRARTLADQGQQYYAGNSYGQYILQADVLGVYTLPLDDSATRIDIRRESFIAAEAAGVDLSVYAKWCFIHPATVNARAGWGDPSGAYIGAVGGTVLVPTEYVFFHELGHHLLSLNHARGVQCSTAGGCTMAPQGDNLDVMGYSYTGYFNAITKSRLGWLIITPVVSSGDYLIEPLETSLDGGIKALSFNIGRKNQPQELVLQYRQPIGFDYIGGPAAGSPHPTNVYNGVEFHMNINGGEQLEMNPYDIATEIYYPTLTVGQMYCNKEGSISATVLSATSAGAVVRMNTKAHC